MTTHEYPTRTVKGTDLNETMTLVGASGGLSSVYETTGSNLVMGCVVVTTEHGPLYLDPESGYEILAADTDLGTQGLDDQPTTCPRCGCRTDFEENPDGSQDHTCPNTACGATFRGIFDPEDFDDDGNFIAGDDDEVMLYHGAKRGARENITQYGLTPGDGLSDEGMLGEGVTQGVFMTPDLAEAAEYGADVWEVDVRGLDLLQVDGPDGYHYVSVGQIPADRVSLHADAAPESPTADVTADVTAPVTAKIMATYNPQAWVRDNAIDVDGAYDFDVTDQILAMGREAALALKDNSDASDNLWYWAVSNAQVPDREGPFTVTVAETIHEFYGEDTDEFYGLGD